MPINRPPWTVQHTPGDTRIVTTDPTDPTRIHTLAIVIEEEKEADTLANAQLLAAAPDLLDACRAALDATYPLRMPGIRPAELHSIRTRIRTILTNAISRATD